MEKPWEDIDYSAVQDLYDKRFNTHLILKRTFDEHDIAKYVPLALEIEEPSGNYSAHEHGLGPSILQSSTPNLVFDLASKLFQCNHPEQIPDIIWRANLPYLKISVGSEMSMMLRPDTFWVTNVRTVWSHLVLKHVGNTTLANEALYLYKSRETDSEMEYRIWSHIHKLVGPSLQKLYNLAAPEAIKRHLKPGDLKLLWADAVANTLYNEYSS